MKYSSAKDINKIVRDLIRAGWTYRRGRRHGRLRAPYGGPELTVPGTPSDWRALIKFKSDVRHAIVSLADPGLRGHQSA